MWHVNLGFAGPGGELEPYPTRTRFPGGRSVIEEADLSPEQHIRAALAHEFGHFLVNWRLGAVMQALSVQNPEPGRISSRGVVRFHYLGGAGRAWRTLVGGAAGERACDRWLREEGLWNPARAVYAEILARHDRRDALLLDPSITFLEGPGDYRAFQDEADRLLEGLWPLLRRGLLTLQGPVTLSGDEVCHLLGIENNTDTPEWLDLGHLGALK